MKISIATKEELSTVHHLAHRIWPVAYRKMISGEQISYMLEKMYDMKTLEKNQAKEGHVFLIAYEKDKMPVGFAAYSPYKSAGKKSLTYKLHKLYILPPMQKKGIGKKILKFITGELEKPSTLILNVNRENPSVLFYEKMGFSILREENNDIGKGFFMNDYVMGKELK